MKSKRILLPDNQLKKASISPMNALKSRWQVWPPASSRAPSMSSSGILSPRDQIALYMLEPKFSSNSSALVSPYEITTRELNTSSHPLATDLLHCHQKRPPGKGFTISIPSTNDYPSTLPAQNSLWWEGWVESRVWEKSETLSRKSRSRDGNVEMKSKFQTTQGTNVWASTLDFLHAPFKCEL
jgi:hypothetical protein